MRMAKCMLVGVVLAFLSGSTDAYAQIGKVERVKVHGKSLEGNLEGDSADPSVSVYLPPSYQSKKSKRFPVVYFLHGYTDSDDKWMGPTKHWINLPSILDKEFAASGAREFIVVMPNGFTRYQGSMYSNSVTTGNWEDFIATELVPYIDQHYRTIPQLTSRGLAGHSMGGYGTMRIGMRHPDVFSSIYVLSGCCMAFGEEELLKMSEKADTVKSLSEVDSADFLTRIVLAASAAWSPDPENPPFFFDLPEKDGKLVEAILGKWNANAPLYLLDQYVANLRKLKGIAVDAGDKDGKITENARAIDRKLATYKIPHQFEIYDGDHLNHIADRIASKVIPYFSSTLSFDTKK